MSYTFWQDLKILVYVGKKGQKQKKRYIVMDKVDDTKRIDSTCFVASGN